MPYATLPRHDAAAAAIFTRHDYFLLAFDAPYYVSAPFSDDAFDTPRR